MRVIVAGSRGAFSADEVHAHMDDLAREVPVTEVVSGGCRGVDQWGEAWASRRGLPVRRFPAEWSKHGKSAGPIRNAAMAEYGDHLVAFWDGFSRGTANMIDEADKRGLPVTLVT